MEGHSELLNEGVEVLGSLPAVLEETECLLRVIKMQMRRMEEKRGFLEKMWQEIMAIPSLESCACFVAPWLRESGESPAKAKPSPWGLDTPNIWGVWDAGLASCSIPAQLIGEQCCQKPQSGGSLGHSPSQRHAFNQSDSLNLPQFPQLRAGGDNHSHTLLFQPHGAMGKARGW